MKRRLISTLLASAMAVGCLTACGGDEAANNSGEASKDSASSSTVVEENKDELDYDYGLNVTFHSDEPVEYSIFFSLGLQKNFKKTFIFLFFFKNIFLSFIFVVFDWVRKNPEKNFC